MSSVWTIVLGLSLVSANAALAQDAPAPALWSGKSGMETVPGSIISKLGDLKPGDLLAKVNERPERTARLTTDYVFGDGKSQWVIKAGTPLYAAQFMTIQAVGSAPLPARRADDVHWCVAAKAPPLVCFRWSGPGKIERAGSMGDMMFSRTPQGGWIQDAEPALKEQPVTFDDPYEESQIINAVTETGVVVTHRYQQDKGGWSYDQPVKWGEPTWRVSGGKVVFQPMRDAAGAVTGATAANAGA
jgi:hypothetical protein